ncbi:MAG: TniQ family protein [Roseburia sp.]|nr:TniQ family protein [Roseburia sp.]
MLSYFPTPYPGEWMYSIYCRYHVRTGHPRHQTTIRELFGNRPSAAIGSIFPNNTISQVVSQLPPGFLDAKQLIIGHTLFPYYTRCYSIAQKEKLLGQLCLGTSTVITSIRRFGQLPAPRYCPLCAERDREAYGETYWHIVHQIPAMQVCPQHGCRLLSVEGIDATRVRYAFAPLDTVLPDLNDAPPEHIPPWHFQFSKILYDYATLPLSCAATPTHSNLAIALGNMGYEVIQGHSPHTILDAKRLYHDLTAHYGQEIVGKVFGDEKAICLLNRVCKWECLTPERYALLQCFAGIDSATVFAPSPLPNALEQKLRGLLESGIPYTQKQMCESLGITASQLGIAVKKYGLTAHDVLQQENFHKISVVFNDTEHEQFKRALARSGFRFDRHFAHHCVMEYLKQYKED